MLKYIFLSPFGHKYKQKLSLNHMMNGCSGDDGDDVSFIIK